MSVVFLLSVCLSIGVSVDILRRFCLSVLFTNAKKEISQILRSYLINVFVSFIPHSAVSSHNLAFLFCIEKCHILQMLVLDS